MKIILLCFSMLLGAPLFSQDTMIVYFADKGSNPVLHELSAKAINRRDKNNVPSDFSDFSVHQNYLNQLSSYGRILTVSRWLNAASFVTNYSSSEIESSLSFVKGIQNVKRGKQPVDKQYDVMLSDKALDYGVADTQVVIMNLDCLHNMGYTGDGALIAIIDAGFRGMDTISYFDILFSEGRVVDQHDFIGGGSDVFQYSSHGTMVASCIVGEKAAPNAFAGTAIDASLALFIAEDVSSETPVEELNVVAALERADSIGADVVNISLGYKTFDDPSDDHPYSDMDGVTTIAARGVNVAGSKGVFVVVSAGNDGPNTISTPCDADSALCVGAVNKSGIYTFFSSIGPSADGQVKPDVAAVGRNAWVVDSDGQIIQANGTSFSSPITAGGAACLVSSVPTATVDNLFDAIRSSASQFATPDEFLGFGIPDFCAAYSSLPGASVLELNSLNIEVFPIPAKSIVYLNGFDENAGVLEIQIVNAAGQILVTYQENVQSSVQLNIENLESGSYFIRCKGTNINLTKKLIVLAN